MKCVFLAVENPGRTFVKQTFIAGDFHNAALRRQVL